MPYADNSCCEWSRALTTSVCLPFTYRGQVLLACLLLSCCASTATAQGSAGGEIWIGEPAAPAHIPSALSLAARLMSQARLHGPGAQMLLRMFAVQVCTVSHAAMSLSGSARTTQR